MSLREIPVSYTHLDVYKRQVLDCEASISFFTDEGEKDMYSEYIFDLSDKNVSDYVIYGKFTTSNMHPDVCEISAQPIGVLIDSFSYT